MRKIAFFMTILTILCLLCSCGETGGASFVELCDVNPAERTDFAAKDEKNAHSEALSGIGGTSFIEIVAKNDELATVYRLPVDHEYNDGDYVCPLEGRPWGYNVGYRHGSDVPVITIYNSYLVTDENQKREILIYIINSEEGRWYGLREEDVDYYIREWSAHNFAYAVLDFIEFFDKSYEVSFNKYRAQHVDCNTDDPRADIYNTWGDLAGILY